FLSSTLFCLCIVTFTFYCSVAHRDLLCFPTRRSSDLCLDNLVLAPPYRMALAYTHAYFIRNFQPIDYLSNKEHPVQPPLVQDHILAKVRLLPVTTHLIRNYFDNPSSHVMR